MQLTDQQPSRTRQPLRQQGLTLIELLTTMSVIAIVLSIGVPSFQSLMANNQITTTTNLFVAAMSLARSEALKRSKTITVAPESDSMGERLVVSTTTNGAVEVIQRIPLPVDMDIITALSEVRFLRSGFMDNNADQTITVCDDVRTGETGKVITIGVSGRLSLSEDTCP